jgi:glycine/D-amino acid oxidase-like deaminating enzyme
MRQDAGAAVHAETAVLGVAATAHAFQVETVRGNVEAGNVFVATNAYADAAAPAYAAASSPRCRCQTI